MKLVLETDRLNLREYTIEDAPFLLRLVNDPAWLRHIGDRKVYTVEDAEQYLLNGSIKSYHDHGFGFWKVENKETGEAMGSAGLAKRDYLEDVDLGFAFLPEYRTQGYGQEAAISIIDFAKKSLGLKNLVAITSQDNIPSINLLVKLGFKYQDKFLLEGEYLNLYKLNL
ncbi:MAG TPA: GNAT family N-acetyltransferase [Saprospiraceae bacterium]|nr:GNAT family N-acetyltransferase [Saprospiraceae bacterium]